MNQQQHPFALIIVGGVMLFIGFLAGYFGRPLIAAQFPAPAAVVDTPAAAATATPQEAAAGAPPPTRAPFEAEYAAVMPSLIEDTRHFKGDPDAPITMIEFSDFQCPYCSRFAVGAGQQIDEAYVESGQVRFGYQHFVFLGENSILAAEASECAADQDAFWPFHDRLIERVAVENQRDFTVDTLKAFAAELELDTESFASCLDARKYNDLVLNETAAAQALGISSTPSFLVNGIFVRGAQPFDVFERVIQMAQATD